MDEPKKRSKHVVLPERMLMRIKRRAIKETEMKGYRVTETYVIEQAIREYLRAIDR